jgi:CBS domain containing-hemolysin-like protein
LLIVVLAVASALLTLAYAALNNTRPSTMKEQADAGNKMAARALELIGKKSKLTITYQLCMALTQTLITVLLIHALWQPLIAESGLAVGLGVGVVAAIVMLIVTQVAPEGIGSVYAKALYPFLTPLLDWVEWLLTPITWLLIALSKFLASLVGGDEKINTVTEEEILTLVNSGEFEDDEKDMIYSVLQLDQRDARQLMVPRMDIVAAEVNESLEKAADLFVASGFSRIPVYEGTIDHIVGLLYAKDLISMWRSGDKKKKHIKDFVRTAFFVPETLRADDLLQTMQKRNTHMAIVVDEYGGTSGLITIENLIEEIVGDIRDEYDQNEELEYTEIAPNEYLLAGSMNIADINEVLDLDIEEGTEYDTIGGFIYATLGRVPHLGDTLSSESFDVTVRSIEGRRIRKVHLLVKPPTESEQRPTTTTTHEMTVVTSTDEVPLTEVPPQREQANELQKDATQLPANEYEKVTPPLVGDVEH